MTLGITCFWTRKTVRSFAAIIYGLHYSAFILYIILVSEISILLVRAPDLFTVKNQALAENIVWFRIEMFLSLAIMVCNSVFLGLRRCLGYNENLDF